MDDVKVVPFRHSRTGRQGWAVIGRQSGWITWSRELPEGLELYVRRQDMSEQKRIEVG
jgi:hypothetical protein